MVVLAGRKGSIDSVNDPLIPGDLWRDKWTALQGYLAHKKHACPLGPP